MRSGLPGLSLSHCPSSSPGMSCLFQAPWRDLGHSTIFAVYIVLFFLLLLFLMGSMDALNLYDYLE